MSTARAGLRPVLWVLLLTAILVVLGVQFADRLIAVFVHAHGGEHVFYELQTIPAWLGMAAVPVIVVLGLVRLSGLSLPRAGRAVFLAALSFIVAIAIKDALKYAFGRPWPETWIHHNPSFIGTGTYGFFPFHGGPGFASFPSGHMTAITSIMGVFCAIWPQLRWLWAGLVLATAIGLLGMDYHFLSDIIAGTALGGLVSLAVVRLNRV